MLKCLELFFDLDTSLSYAWKLMIKRIRIFITHVKHPIYPVWLSPKGNLNDIVSYHSILHMNSLFDDKEHRQVLMIVSPKLLHKEKHSLSFYNTNDQVIAPGLLISELKWPL